MAEDTDKHEQARKLTEQALDKLVQHKDTEADKLIDKAKAVDESAVREVVAELDEDAEATGKSAG